MPTEAYHRWVRAGRPWRACRPATELRAVLHRHAPRVPLSSLGILGAEKSHLRDATPADHTPFSQDPWPQPLPGYWVCALDVVHAPHLGLDCDVIANRLVVDAKAGRFPALKYAIWNGGDRPLGLRDVRYGWRPQSAGGHRDHAHFSFRTDYLQSSIPRGYDPIEKAQTDTERRDKMLYFVRERGRRPVWVSDMIHRRWISDRATLDRMLKRADAKVYETDDIDMYGVPVGPKPGETPAP